MAASFQLRFMVFAVNAIDSRGPINEMHRQLKSKAKVRLY